MSPLIKDESVDAVLAAADIVDVVSGYTRLERRGPSYLGLCPFHQEKTPSFSVSPEKGLYYCFGCGVGGDLLTFVQEKEGLGFGEAVEYLADRFSVSVEYAAGQDRGGDDRSRERRVYDLLEKTASFYQRYLWGSQTGANARRYLEERGLEREVCEEFRLGLAPAAWKGLYTKAKNDGFADDELVAAGLVVQKEGRTYDRFRGRLMFPLIDHRGRTLGFGGRALGDDKPKYLNSPEGPVYHKGRLLYGLYQARRPIAEHDEILVVEGYTDVLALVQVGVENVVASMGTALTDQQLELMTRFTRNVTFMFDADRAGADAALRSGRLAQGRGLWPMVVLLPQGQDPADVAGSEGETGIRRLLSARVPLLRFEIEQVLENEDTGRAEGRVRAFERVRRLLARARSSKEREEEVVYLADRLRLTPENVTTLIRESARAGRSGGGRGKAEQDSHEQAETSDSRFRRLLSRELQVEKDFLVAAVCNLDVAGGVVEDLSAEHFQDLVHREVFLRLREILAGDDVEGELRALAQGDSEVGRFFVRLVFEKDQARYSRAVLNELSLRLQDQHLGRTISDLRRRLDGEDRESVDEERLFRLEVLRQRVRELLADVDEME